MELDTVGKRLKFARKAHTPELTQAQLAEMTGIKQASISRLERGVFYGTKFVVELAEALGVSTEWLSKGSGAMKNTSAEPTGQLARLVMILEPLNLTEGELKEVVNAAIIKASEIVALK
ncbi:helix-turn-helix transcriptional regulator [Photobacterium damselae subsp. damselae]|uniref:helix-turn-helix domain-containing protein n=1 Tax=Photobacterium damselae TaxID=38293 RepID=UPI00311AF84B